MLNWWEIGFILYGAYLLGLGLGWGLADYWLRKGPWLDRREQRRKAYDEGEGSEN